MIKTHWRVLWCAGLAFLFCEVADVRAQSSLGTAQSFAVLGGSTVTSTGPSVISGHVGVSPGSAITGFPPAIVVPPGTIHAGDALAGQAQADLTSFYNDLASTPCQVVLTGVDLGGMTLTPAVYCFATSAQLSGILTLNALGNPNAEFVFQIASTLTTASGSQVVMINQGNPCGVSWQVGSSATLGTNASFVGNIVALVSITLTTGVDLIGRALARTGAVTLDTSDVTNAPCGGPPVPTLPTWFMIALVGLLALAGFTALSKRDARPGQSGF